LEIDVQKLLCRLYNRQKPGQLRNDLGVSLCLLEKHHRREHSALAVSPMISPDHDQNSTNRGF
jgi:hypothetical protein